MRECTNSPLTLALGLPCLKSQACSGTRAFRGGCASPTMLKTWARAPINILPRSANESFRGLLPDRHASLQIGVVNCTRPTAGAARSNRSANIPQGSSEATSNSTLRCVSSLASFFSFAHEVPTSLLFRLVTTANHEEWSPSCFPNH